MRRWFSQYVNNSRFDMFQTQISAMDEYIAQCSYGRFEPFFGKTSEDLTVIGLFGRGRGTGCLKFAKRVMEGVRENENQEFFVHPVWDSPCDWNQYISLIKTLKFPESKVFWAGRNSPIWQNVFPEETLNYSIAHMPDHLSTITEKKGLSTTNSHILASGDFKNILTYRINELKSEGKLILFIDLQHEKSCDQLIVRARKVLQNFEHLNDEEKSKITFKFVTHCQETVETALQELSDKFQVLHKEILTSNLETHANLISNPGLINNVYTNWVKEKIGSQFFYSLDSNREFELKQRIMNNFFADLSRDVKENPPEVHHNSLVLLLQRTHKIN